MRDGAEAARPFHCEPGKKAPFQKHRREPDTISLLARFLFTTVSHRAGAEGFVQPKALCRELQSVVEPWIVNASTYNIRSCAISDTRPPFGQGRTCKSRSSHVMINIMRMQPPPALRLSFSRAYWVYVIEKLKRKGVLLVLARFVVYTLLVLRFEAVRSCQLAICDGVF